MVKVRKVRKGDLARVREVIESGFADYFERQLGSRPRQVFGGAQYVHHRWLMEPWGCFVAEENDTKIVGASIAITWGKVGIFGPVAVLTPYQNQKIAQSLLKASQGFFDENKVTLQGLATFYGNPKHLILYQKFGFKPKGLIAVTTRSLERREPTPPARPSRSAPQVRHLSSLKEAQKKTTLGRLRGITNRIYPGMDLVDPEVDHVALARSLGVQAERVEKPGDLRSVLEKMLTLDAPTLVDVAIDRSFKPML